MGTRGAALRVAVDTVSLLDTRTGVGRFVDETVRRLAPRPDLDLRAFGQWPRARRAMREVLPSGISVSPVPLVGAPLRVLWRRMPFPPVELWTGPVDVVHGPNFLVPPAWRASMLVTVHDLTIMRYPQFCTDDTLQFPRLITRLLDRGAWVHTVSQFVADEVVELLGADPDRVVAIPNGVDPIGPGDPTAGRALAGGDRYVLALGTVEPRKDLPRLVDAFDLLADALPDVRLVIAGPDGWGAEELHRRVQRSPHASRIVRLGFVSEEDRVALLRGAELLAYPSIYEGFGLPPLEAMTAGTPVVTTRTGGITEVVGDAAVLIGPGDTDALAGAIESVLTDEGHRARLREAGPERAAEFSWDRTAEGLAALYHRIAAQKA